MCRLGLVLAITVIQDNDMTDKNSTPKSPQQIVYAEKQAHLAEFKKRLNSMVRKAAKELAAENSDYKDFCVIPQNVTYMKNKEGVILAIFKIAEQMMWPSSMEKTQDQIRADVQTLFPGLEIKKGIWGRPLLGKVRKRVDEIVTGNMMSAPSFAKCKTLSQFRRKVLTQRKVASGLRTFKLPITIGKDTVVIGSQAYALERYNVGKYKYPRIRIECKGKRQPLRMDVLASALIAGEGKVKE